MEKQARRHFDYLRLFYALNFAGVGCFWPYITLFFKRIGFNGDKIGLLTATGSLALLISQPIWGIVSDKTKSIPRLLSFAAIVAMGAVLLFLISNQFWEFMVLMAVFSFFSYAIIPLADTLSMGFVNQHKLNFGQIRMWGSLGYCIVVVIVGQIATYPGLGRMYHYFHPNLSAAMTRELSGLPVCFLAYAVMILAAFLVTLRLPKYSPKSSFSFGGGVTDLLKNGRFAAFLFCVFLLQATTSANTNYYGLYIDHLHGQTGLIGLAMTISATSEIPVFLFASRIFRRFNSLHLLAAAGFAGAIRWYLCTLISNPVTALWLQPFHAINFGCFYLGAVHFVDEETPHEWKTTGQTLFWAVGYGLAAIAGNYLGGLIYNGWGVITLFRIGAVIAGVSGLLFYLMDKFSKHRK